jgi:hypothetical protein
LKSSGNSSLEAVLAAAEKEINRRLKRVAIVQISSSRFMFLFYRMSLSQNRCTLLRDML